MAILPGQLVREPFAIIRLAILGYAHCSDAAPEYDVDTNQVRPLDVVTNSFCAGGGVTGDGTWVNLGGKLASATPLLYRC